MRRPTFKGDVVMRDVVEPMMEEDPAVPNGPATTRWEEWAYVSLTS